jgi:hypothetical protein
LKFSIDGNSLPTNVVAILYNDRAKTSAARE